MYLYYLYKALSLRFLKAFKYKTYLIIDSNLLKFGVGLVYIIVIEDLTNKINNSKLT